MTPSALGIAADVRARRVSAEETTRAALARLDAAEPTLRAFLDVFHDRALERARAIDERIARGEAVGPLAGVPVAVKDNLCLAWGRTTAGSRMLERYESPFTATAVQRLIDAGAVIIGKTNCDEFAMGSSGEHSAFGPTLNPWDPARVPGGSSSGSAAAVAAGVTPIALGSDTGGSVRQPAAHCGVFGLKPTYGRVSRHGLIAFASSLDQVGTLTRTVGDAAASLAAIAGADPLDATSSEHAAPDFADALDDPDASWRGGLVLGVPRQARGPGNHPAVAAALDEAIRVFGSLGARVEEADLPHADHGVAAYYIVATAEASSNLARYDGVRYGRRAEVGGGGGELEAMYCRSRGEGFGAEVRRRIMLGTRVLSSGYHEAYYTTALRVRRRIKQDFDACFARGCHALLMPATPGPAFRLGEKSGDPLAMYLEDVYTVGVNLAGLPAITVPAGFADEGGVSLPVGLQLVGPAWEERRVLRLARLWERATDWWSRRPAIGS